ncbi:hypothetical protein [Magnetospirillum fulvum]|uniref:Uncharacterized protein n=1 Tax=Magnetospirillum fulvum MGU-K5 TaxID=1316936 RepID=S9S7U8_MAGFU|nr:hypothetical protein [Magnetospirillum fulvum]EPY00158.1 hypothetical protein K678_17521 [Magnetospirillum fulvum MGU-K5]
MEQLDFSMLDTMTEADECRFMDAFTQALANDSGDVAKEHLAAGRSVYFGDDQFPDAVVKEYPDGRRQLVTFVDDDEIILRDL